MPVLINQNTGLAEDIDHQLADSALQEGSHALPLNDPQGNPVIAPLSEAQSLLAQGYTQPNQEQLSHLLNHAKFSSPLEQAKTFAEHAAASSTFGLSRGAESALFKNAEEQRSRTETNPNVGMAGDIAGLGVSSLIPGVGEGALLGKAGQAVEAASGLGKIAGGAARLATEGGLYEWGNEVGKMFEQDPGQTIGSAIAHTGLSAILTPAIGLPIEGAGNLWASTIGRKLSPYLDAAKSKLGIGTEAEIAQARPPEVEKLLEKYPEIKGTLGDNPTGEQVHQHLLKSDTSYGREYREKLDNFKTDLNTQAIESLGYKPESLDALANKSNFEVGTDLKKGLTDTLEEKIKPFEKRYEDIENKYSQVPITDDIKQDIGTKIAQMAEKEGYNLSPSSAQFSEINRVQNEIGNLKNLTDLKKYTTKLSENTNSPDLWRVGSEIKKILNESRNNLLTKSLGEVEGPEALANHLAVNNEYKKLAGLVDELDGQLKVPRWSGPGTFIKGLKEMEPETILKRLSDKDNVGLIKTLQEQFPDVAQKLSQTLRDSEMRAAISRNGEFNLKTLMSNAEKKMTKEYKEFVFGDSLDHAKQFSDTLSDISFNDNPSNTSGGIDKLFAKVPLHLGAGALLMHGNPILAGLAEVGGHFFTREAPDAVRMSWLRFLGKNHATDPVAFKAMVETANKTIKGLKAIDKAVKSILPGAGHVAIEALSDKTRNKLEKASLDFEEDPTKFLNVGNELGRYEPNHAAAMGSTLSSGLTAINEARPKTQASGMLDDDRVPSEVENMKYERTLENVENPLRILKHLQDGTITPEDMQTFMRVYPDLHKMMAQKLTNEIITAKSKDIDIPYHVKMGLSLFLGAPVDSTFTPQFIMSNQAKPQTQQPSPKQGQKGSKKALDKWASLEETPIEKSMHSKA